MVNQDEMFTGDINDSQIVTCCKSRNRLLQVFKNMVEQTNVRTFVRETTKHHGGPSTTWRRSFSGHSSSRR